jgi:hypothetical protein
MRSGIALRLLAAAALLIIVIPLRRTSHDERAAPQPAITHIMAPTSRSAYSEDPSNSAMCYAVAMAGCAYWNPAGAFMYHATCRPSAEGACASSQSGGPGCSHQHTLRLCYAACQSAAVAGCGAGRGQDVMHAIQQLNKLV